MKWRNQLLALVCLLAFAGWAFIYFQHWVIRKPFGIILFIGEGLSPAIDWPRRAPTQPEPARALNLDSMPICRFDDELLERFRGSGSSGCGDSDRDRRASD